MYRCQEYVLYVWGPWLKPFWETENIISYDLLWYKSKLSAVNPIHNYSSVCEDEGKWVLYDMELACKIKISCFSQQILMKMFEIHFVDVYETSIIRFFGWEIFFFLRNQHVCFWYACLAFRTAGWTWKRSTHVCIWSQAEQLQIGGMGKENSDSAFHFCFLLFYCSFTLKKIFLLIWSENINPSPFSLFFKNLL